MKALILRIIHTSAEDELTLVTGGTLQILIIPASTYVKSMFSSFFFKFTPISLRPEKDFPRFISHSRRSFYLQKADGNKE
jgi:hypothetical protein